MLFPQCWRVLGKLEGEQKNNVILVTEGRVCFSDPEMPTALTVVFSAIPLHPDVKKGLIRTSVRMEFADEGLIISLIETHRHVTIRNEIEADTAEPARLSKRRKEEKPDARSEKADLKGNQAELSRRRTDKIGPNERDLQPDPAEPQVADIKIEQRTVASHLVSQPELNDRPTLLLLLAATNTARGVQLNLTPAALEIASRDLADKFDEIARKAHGNSQRLANLARAAARETHHLRPVPASDGAVTLARRAGLH